MMHEPYAPRAVRCLDVWATDGWRLKVYGIAYRGETPRPELIEAAKLQAASSLPRPATGGGRYGVGFLGIHDGFEANLVFVDWWADENELHHKVFLSPSSLPRRLRPTRPLELTACVWDLAVIGFERDAWVKAVLRQPSGTNLDRYLATQMCGQV